MSFIDVWRSSVVSVVVSVVEVVALLIVSEAGGSLAALTLRVCFLKRSLWRSFSRRKFASLRPSGETVRGGIIGGADVDDVGGSGSRGTSSLIVVVSVVTVSAAVVVVVVVVVVVIVVVAVKVTAASCSFCISTGSMLGPCGSFQRGNHCGGQLCWRMGVLIISRCCVVRRVSDSVAEVIRVMSVLWGRGEH